MAKTKYVVVGVGGRSRFFYNALVSTYASTSELVAFCDINQKRMDYANKQIQTEYGAQPVNTYFYTEFDEMIKQEQPDVVIVTTIDRTHHHYITRAMELGCDVITEKPMTTDAKKCQQILDAINKTGRELRVTFNYRYAPHNTKIRELIMDDAIGDVTSVHFEWLLDINHGADYFRRWHRDKRNSGGLLVHKATHHFDLVNFWLGAAPVRVFAMGDLLFYGRENAENRGYNHFYYRSTGSPGAIGDPFALHMDKKENLRQMYLEAEEQDGYIRDQSVFGDGISIEDTMAVLVKYDNKAMLSYSLNAYLPWEGFRVAINGTKGRIQAIVGERTYINSGGEPDVEGTATKTEITVFPMFGEPYNAPVIASAGGHGGGDPKLLQDLFGVREEDRFNRAATHVDGAMSILTGIAANESIRKEIPININDLINWG